MNWNLVEKMIDAGFKADDILKIYNGSPFVDGSSIETSLEKGSEGDEVVTENLAENTDTTSQNPEAIDYTTVINSAISQGFKELTDALIKNNIVNSQIPQNDGDDDILAQIIAPKLKERK